MYGLGAAGTAAVPTLMGLLGDEGLSDNTANHLAHALGEAAREPDVQVVSVLAAAMARGASHVTADSGTIDRLLPAPMAERLGVDKMRVVQYGTDGRLLQATCAQALGCVGQRAAALGNAQVVAAVLELLAAALADAEPLDGIPGPPGFGSTK